MCTISTLLSRPPPVSLMDGHTGQLMWPDMSYFSLCDGQYCYISVCHIHKAICAKY